MQQDLHAQTGQWKLNESGQTTVNAGELSAGTYTYTLVVNSKAAASKKMVLVK